MNTSIYHIIDEETRYVIAEFYTELTAIKYCHIWQKEDKKVYIISQS